MSLKPPTMQIYSERNELQTLILGSLLRTWMAGRHDVLETRWIRHPVSQVWTGLSERDHAPTVIVVFSTYYDTSDGPYQY